MFRTDKSKVNHSTWQLMELPGETKMGPLKKKRRKRLTDSIVWKTSLDKSSISIISTYLALLLKPVCQKLFGSIPFITSVCLHKHPLESQTPHTSSTKTSSLHFKKPWVKTPTSLEIKQQHFRKPLSNTRTPRSVPCFLLGNKKPTKKHGTFGALGRLEVSLSYKLTARSLEAEPRNGRVVRVCARQASKQAAERKEIFCKWVELGFRKDLLGPSSKNKSSLKKDIVSGKKKVSFLCQSPAKFDS